MKGTMKRNRWTRLWRLSFALAWFSVACAHHVTVPKQTEIPSPVIGRTVCIEPADPTGQTVIPCPGGR